MSLEKLATCLGVHFTITHTRTQSLIREEKCVVALLILVDRRQPLLNHPYTIVYVISLSLISSRELKNQRYNIMHLRDNVDLVVTHCN